MAGNHQRTNQGTPTMFGTQFWWEAIMQDIKHEVLPSLMPTAPRPALAGLMIRADGHA